MLKKLIAAGTATLSLFVFPASAQDYLSNTEGFYVDGGVGGSYSRHLDFKQDNVVFKDDDSSFGLGLRAAAGYAFGNGFRAEVEYTFRNNKEDNLDGGDGVSIEDKFSSNSIMFNAIADLAVNDTLSVFAGAGLGYTFLNEEISAVAGSTTTELADGDDSKFTGQLIAGVSYKVNENLEVGASYRYLVNLGRFDLEYKDLLTGDEGTVERNYRSHGLFIEARYYFPGY